MKKLLILSSLICLVASCKKENMDATYVADIEIFYIRDGVQYKDIAKNVVFSELTSGGIDGRSLMTNIKCSQLKAENVAFISPVDAYYVKNKKELFCK